MQLSMLLIALLFASNLAAQPAPEVWRLVEELRIGSVEGPQAMTRVADITTSADGRYLYVVESAERAVWMFDAGSGRFIRKIGRGGDGPGEFRSPLKLGWRGDTLYVTDGQLPRITLFAATGEYYRTITFQSPALPQTGLGIAPIGYTAAGDVLATPLLASQHVRGGQLASISWYLLNRSGAIMRTVGLRELRGGGKTVSFGSPMSRGRTVQLSLPLTDRNFLGMEPDGESLLLLDQPAGTDPIGRFRIRRLSLDGDTLYARTYRYAPRAVSRPFRDSVRAERAAMYAEAFNLEPARVRGIMQEHLTFPEYHPPFTALRGWLTITRDGGAWLRREDLGGSTVHWLVVSPAGDVTGSVVAPREMRILHVEAGKVWGFITDEYDVPYVVRSKLVAREAR